MLARRVSAEGRTRAYVNGRSRVGGRPARRWPSRSVAFYGQHEHRAPDAGLGAARRSSTPRAGPSRPRGATRARPRWARARALERALDELRERAGARERELDLLAFELAEIEEAAPDEAEEARAARARASACATSRRCGRPRWAAAEAVAPEDGAGVAALLAAGGGALDGVAGVDAGARRARRALAGASRSRPTTSPRELRRYAEGLEAEPGRARRRRGAPGRAGPPASASTAATIAAVLAHAEALPRAPRRAGRGRGGARGGAGGARGRARRARRPGRRAARGARRAGAARWRAPSARGWPSWPWRARRSPSRWPTASPGRRAPTRSSSVIAPNPGVPAAPLREIASGGELSRVMLALIGVPTTAAGATLVFDEVDAGIGGHTARAVGEQLRALADGPPGRLHHPPAADRVAGRAPLLDRQGPARRAGAHDGRRARRARRSWASSCACSARPTTTSAPRRHAKELRRAA